jgi:hypothetical protein
MSEGVEVPDVFKITLLLVLTGLSGYVASCAHGGSNDGETPRVRDHLAKQDPLLTSERLRMMDSYEIKKLLQDRLNSAREVRRNTMVTQQGDTYEREHEGVGEMREVLRGGLRILFSRPESDDLSRFYIDAYRTELLEDDNYVKVLAELSGEATRYLGQGATGISVQSTYVTILENILEEVRPSLKKGDKYRILVQKIADADIELSSELKNYRKLNSMETSISPSVLAQRILKDDGLSGKKK